MNHLSFLEIVIINTWRICFYFYFFLKSSTRLYKSYGICKLYKLSSGTTKHNVPLPIKESPQWIHLSLHWMWAVIRLTDMFDFLLWVTSDPLGISMLIACKLHNSWHTFDKNITWVKLYCGSALSICLNIKSEQCSMFQMTSNNHWCKGKFTQTFCLLRYCMTRSYVRSLIIS